MRGFGGCHQHIHASLQGEHIRSLRDLHLAGQKHLEDASRFPGIKALLKVILVLLATSAGPYNRERSLC